MEEKPQYQDLISKLNEHLTNSTVVSPEYSVNKSDYYKSKSPAVPPPVQEVVKKSRNVKIAFILGGITLVLVSILLIVKYVAVPKIKAHQEEVASKAALMAASQVAASNATPSNETAPTPKKKMVTFTKPEVENPQQPRVQQNQARPPPANVEASRVQPPESSNQRAVYPTSQPEERQPVQPTQEERSERRETAKKWATPIDWDD